MKIVSSNQMADIEALAYRDGASSSDFMEEAGSGIALVVHDYCEKHEAPHIAILLCGKGNNAGDAYVAGCQLLSLDYDVVAVQLFDLDECSFLCKQNYERFLADGGRVSYVEIDFPERGVILDGIFGTGFEGVPEGRIAEAIKSANESKLPIIAVDIPSGLNGRTGETPGEAIIATETAFLGLPKTGFFLTNGWNHVGILRYVDFGLPNEYIAECITDKVMLSEDMMKPLMPKIKRNRSKYEAGYVVALAGSRELPGAAILSSIAALRSGAGIVRLLYPEGMENELAAIPCELIKTSYRDDDLDFIVNHMNQAAATFIGPGLGTSPKTAELLRALLPRIQKPCVLDADALNIISQNPDIILPKDVVMTPHIGEMMRLLQIKERPLIDASFLNTCQTYATDKQITLIVKGGPSFIFHGNSPIMINPTGDPGMATAGSGDVLTGMIASLLAQGLHSEQAAILAVYLHGLSGEYAAEVMTSYGMTASDLIYHFPEAFKSLT